MSRVKPEWRAIVPGGERRYRWFRLRELQKGLEDVEVPSRIYGSPLPVRGGKGPYDWEPGYPPFVGAGSRVGVPDVLIVIEDGHFCWEDRDGVPGRASVADVAAATASVAAALAPA
ncbi:hypothetical protein ACQEU5_06755 [Marinactinospora thermotolerans]|uniref:Uncharacterized protein n=1 Tax=Marinactinospora thermotolerans DSM 45154 TaxID=1122192 RepID=A0A1T4SSE3_9ACTN|nr:hypothetical protein [Marinactinospora thermotolerans]SKA30791.1 hypothetical protein SAMN02745673_03829 [Marinactinospora thermotolerans DSM 45154]